MGRLLRRSDASLKAFNGSSVWWTPARMSNSEPRPSRLMNRFHASTHSRRAALKNLTACHFSTRSELPSRLAKFLSVIKITCSNNCSPSLGGSGGVTDLEEKSVDRVSGAGAPTPRGVSGGGLPPLGERRAFFLRGRRGAFTSASKLGGKGGLAIHENERQRTTLNTIEITGLVLKNVLTKQFFGVFFAAFTYEKRRGRESNPRIAVAPS